MSRGDFLARPGGTPGGRALESLREERDALAERVRQLELEVAPPLLVPARWGVTPGEGRVLSYLIARSPVPRTQPQVLAALWDCEAGGPLPNVVSVLVSRLRRKLLALGVRVQSRHGHGFWLEREDADRLRALATPPPPEASRFLDLSRPFPGLRGLTPAQGRMLRVLLAECPGAVPPRELGSRAQLLTRSDLAVAVNCNVSRIRKILAPLGVRVDCRRLVGYSLSPGSAARLESGR